MNANYQDIAGPHGLLARRLQFHGNSMWAERCTTIPTRGELNADEYYRLTSDFLAANGRDMYVVYSYITPIAWGLVGEPAYCVAQRFSVTSSKHQGYTRAWINHSPGFAAYRAERERLGV